MNKDCHFSGWATRNDLLCGDGRVICRDAFKDCDGETVPLLWNHNHTDQDAVLGHALLSNRDEGVYAYCTFNDTKDGLHAKKLVENGDISSLSIYANKLIQMGNQVIHGAIRELSLVHAGANPGAYIDFVMAHDSEGEDGFEACYDENVFIIHSQEASSKEEVSSEETLQHSEEKEKEDKPMAEEIKKTENKEGDKTVQDVFDSMTEEQKNVVYAMVGMALEDGEDDDDEEGDDDMKHNLFDQDEMDGANVLTHSDQEEILRIAKSSNVGSLQAALQIFADDNALQHDAISGFVQEGTPYNITTLFPDYKEVRPGYPTPDLLTNDQGWITEVMRKVHKSPISRIRTSYVDIRNLDTLRAKGYKKGKEKTITGNFNLARRTTDPQTIYVKNALHRDDIVDITDFDYVQYMYNIDKMMLNEEIATAIMFGDGREEGDEYKIAEDKIRPIWTDDELYTIHVDLDIEAAKSELQGSDTGVHFGENYITAEAMTNTVLYAREKYKGTGTPDLFITPHMLNVMLLARDMNGRRIYSSKSELASTLNVGNIYTVEQLEGKTRTVDGGEKQLLALIVNLSDYALGATKGGEVTHFTQFDIDFNQQKSLLETRISGALTKLYSAIAIEKPVTGAAG